MPHVIMPILAALLFATQCNAMPKVKAFEDPDGFFGAAASGGIHVATWIRAAHLEKGVALWGQHRDKKGEIVRAWTSAKQIGQGSVGDCWLLAACAAFAAFAGHLGNLFEETDTSESGKYTVRLYDIFHKRWEKVVIDDRLPCNGFGRPLFTPLTEGKALWPLLLEKACAKFAGSYQKLHGGNVMWAFQVLTGQRYLIKLHRRSTSTWQQISWEDPPIKDEAGHRAWRQEGMRAGKSGFDEKSRSDHEAFRYLAECSQAGFLITCDVLSGGGEAIRSDGLIAGHEYSVLQVVCVQDKGSKNWFQLVQLRNPWGKGEWKREWGDKSGVWKKYKDIADDLHHMSKDDGLFWMPWESFASIFGPQVSVCAVTLPCPRTEHDPLTRPAHGHGCPLCHNAYSRVWVMTDAPPTRKQPWGTWINLKDKSDGSRKLCTECARSTSRATSCWTPGLRLAGIHSWPDVGKKIAPPLLPKRPGVMNCSFDERGVCTRRDPEHYQQFWHPSLLRANKKRTEEESKLVKAKNEVLKTRSATPWKKDGDEASKKDTSDKDKRRMSRPHRSPVAFGHADLTKVKVFVFLAIIVLVLVFAQEAQDL